MIGTIDEGDSSSAVAAELEVLRLDVRSRVRVPAAKRDAILDAFETSGLSGAAFARDWGLKYPKFGNCLKRLRRPPDGLDQW